MKKSAPARRTGWATSWTRTILEKGNNLERWTKGPKEGGLKMWEKRVLMTHIAGRAWELICCGSEGREPYDFEASARRIGMLMTADGSDDDKIQVQDHTPSRTPMAVPTAARKASMSSSVLNTDTVGRKRWRETVVTIPRSCILGRSFE